MHGEAKYAPRGHSSRCATQVRSGNGRCSCGETPAAVARRCVCGNSTHREYNAACPVHGTTAPDAEGSVT